MVEKLSGNTALAGSAPAAVELQRRRHEVRLMSDGALAHRRGKVGLDRAATSDQSTPVGGGG